MGMRIGLIGTGAMGSAVGARCVERGTIVVANLEGRSEASVARAKAAGIIAGADEDIARADLILSIVPPSEAVGTALRIAPALNASERPATWVDLNAINPATVTQVAGIVRQAGASFVGGAIIGFPAESGETGPTIYLSGPSARMAAPLGDLRLTIKIIEGAEEAASALKISYAGITKGLVAIASMMILAADEAGAGAALRAELGESQPQLLARFQKTIPDMLPKAYRWVAEMEEIASFSQTVTSIPPVYRALGAFYDEIAAAVQNDGSSIRILNAFTQKDHGG